MSPTLTFLYGGLGFKLISLCLHGRHFTNWALSLDLSFLKAHLQSSHVFEAWVSPHLTCLHPSPLLPCWMPDLLHPWVLEILECSHPLGEFPCWLSAAMRFSMFCLHIHLLLHVSTSAPASNLPVFSAVRLIFP